jgi:hypothetical protein
MSAPVIRGTSDLVFQGNTRRFSKQSGHQTGYIYEGTTTAAETFYFSLAIAGTADDVDMDIDGVNGTSRITVWYGGTSSETTDQEDTFDTWELVGNIETKGIYTHPKARALTTAEIAEIKNAVTAVEEDPTTTHTFAKDDATDIFNHVVAGYDGYQLPQYVLRRTTTVGALYSGKLNFEDTFKLFTTAQVKLAESIPAGIQWDMDAIDSNLPSLGTGGTLAEHFEYRWLKQPPARTQTGINKFNLTYEYWHAAWSTFLYDSKA